MKTFLKRIFLLGLCFIPFVSVPFVAVFCLIDRTATGTIMGELIPKLQHLESVQSPKIVFIGGSGCSHGINSETVEKYFGLPVVNMGLHASLGLAYQLSSIDASIRKGDYVIIIPEYHNFKSCLGGRELLMVVSDILPQERRKLDTKQWCNLVGFMPEYGFNKLKRLFVNSIKHPFKKYSAKVDKDYGKYKYDERGDMIGSRNDSRNLGFAPFSYQSADGLLTGKENDCLRRISDFIAAHRDATIAVFPPAIQNISFDNQISYIEAVEKALKDNGTPFAVPAARYRMLNEECWDTPYHLNGLGIKRRTALLVEDLKTIIQ